MKYWEDFRSLSGFDNGNTIPEGYAVFRDVYCRTVNVLAAWHGSKFRVAPCDDAQGERVLLIIDLDVDYYNYWELDRSGPDGLLPVLTKLPTSRDATQTQPPDLGLTEAIRSAKQLEVDKYVIVEARVSPAFEDLLAIIGAS